MVSISLGSVGGGVLTYTDFYNQFLATTLQTAVQSLTTAESTGPGNAPQPGTSGTQSLLLTGNGGTYNIPAGWQYILDDIVTALNPVKITGAGGTYLLGNENLFFDSAAGTSMVLAGNGQDTFQAAGTYTIAAGSGADSYNLSGNGIVSLGSGTNSVLVSSGADTVYAAPDSGGSLVVGTGGGFVFYGANNSSTVVDTLYGGNGSVSGGFNVEAWGGANEAIDLINQSSSLPSFMAAGAGNETLVAASSTGLVQMWGSKDPGSHDLLLAPARAPGDLIGGAGTDSLVGGVGLDVFYIVANTASGVTPKDLIYNANQTDVLALVGYDTLYGGAAGSNTASKLISAAFASGSSSVTLKDGTTITFANTSGPNGIHFVSS